MKVTKLLSRETSLRYVALAMIGTTLMYTMTQSLPAYLGLVALIFGLFIYYHRSHWQVFGRWGGKANVLTVARGLLLLGLAGGVEILNAYVALGLGILVLVLDGLDGYYARKYNTVSAFGDVLDKEVDALFVLTFGMIITDQQWAGSWIILPGLLRYGYVIGLSFLDRPPSPGGSSFRRQFAGMWLMGTLLAPLVLPRMIYLPALIFATGMTTLSFGIDFYYALRARSSAQV